MSLVDHLIKYARNELKITNFDQSEISETILKFIEQSAKITNNDPESMKKIANLLPLLIDQFPISMITEDDFIKETHCEGDKNATICRCTRYEYLYQTGDGKYWDDRAITYKFKDSNNDSEKMYLYQTKYNSKQEVFLPYYPGSKVVIIDRDKIS